MKKNLIKAVKWLLLGIVCGILTVVFYLTERNLGDVPCRFDVIGIENSKITHITNAFTG